MICTLGDERRARFSNKCLLIYSRSISIVLISHYESLFYGDYINQRLTKGCFTCVTISRESQKERGSFAEGDFILERVSGSVRESVSERVFESAYKQSGRLLREGGLSERG